MNTRRTVLIVILCVCFRGLTGGQPKYLVQSKPGPPTGQVCNPHPRIENRANQSTGI